MDLESAAARLAADPNYRVLRRVQLAEHHVFAENRSGEPVGRLAVIDTETTGFEPGDGHRPRGFREAKVANIKAMRRCEK